MSKPTSSSELEKLKDRLTSNRMRLKSLQENNTTLDDITTLKSKRVQKEADLQRYRDKWFESYYTEVEKFTVEEINRIDLQIVRKSQIEELKKDIERDEKALSIKQKPLKERSLPTRFDDSAVDHYLELFEELLEPVTPNVPFINITMVGEAGAGKSSFLNTVATALENSNCIKESYRVSPAKGRENSATKTVDLKYLLLRGEKPLYIRYFDIPGIATENNVGVEELLMFINGEIKQGAKMVKASEMIKNKDIINENPTDCIKIHCILYVVKASSNLSLHMSRSLEKMHRIRQRLLDEKVRQFALVTHIDEIGVPNDNMKNASELPCTTSICQKVGTIFDLDEYHVIPMSSYFSEKGPNIAKNIMALSALWRVCQSGRSYIREELGKEPDLEGFFD